MFIFRGAIAGICVNSFERLMTHWVVIRNVVPWSKHGLFGCFLCATVLAEDDVGITVMTLVLLVRTQKQVILKVSSDEHSLVSFCLL